jgi:hypothetical protein
MISLIKLDILFFEQMRPSMRQNYQNQGVSSYYQTNHSTYRNPHYPTLLPAFQKFMNSTTLSHFESLSILDVACGSGEATQCFQQWTSTNNIKLTYQACDPFTSQAYENVIGQPAHPYSFNDIANGCLNQQFTMAVCSFAMHLAKESLLHPLLSQLSCHSLYLLVISPHKKPIINDPERYGFVLLERMVIDRIHFRLFQSVHLINDGLHS